MKICLLLHTMISKYFFGIWPLESWRWLTDLVTQDLDKLTNGMLAVPPRWEGVGKFRHTSFRCCPWLPFGWWQSADHCKPGNLQQTHQGNVQDRTPFPVHFPFSLPQMPCFSLGAAAKEGALLRMFSSEGKSKAASLSSLDGNLRLTWVKTLM